MHSQSVRGMAVDDTRGQLSVNDTDEVNRRSRWNSFPRESLDSQRLSRDNLAMEQRDDDSTQGDVQERRLGSARPLMQPAESVPELCSYDLTTG